MDKQQARKLSAPALMAVGLFGLNSMFGQIYRNGYIERIGRILASQQPTLPGSHTPLLTRYLGLPVVDNLLAIATVLWANVTDGSCPELSLYAVQFGGQLVPVFLVMMLEGSRSGNTNNAFFFSIMWGYTMQTFGYAITMPIYAIIHLFISPTFLSSGKVVAKEITPRATETFSLQCLIPAFALGYFLPSVLMSWPLSSPTLHQWLGAVWQGFPLYVVLFQHLFTRLAKPSATLKGDAETLETLSEAYTWAFQIARATQFFTYGLIILTKIFPSLLPSYAVDAFTFAKVFRPGPFHSTKPLVSMAAAMHDFFKWDQYVGSAAAIIWGITLDVTSRKHNINWDYWMRLGWEIVRWSIEAGPAGALVRLLQRRDKAILSK
ncbi:hypothetical protein F4805DRAFT_177111 [Annulohypoxylon moriforme]|nr:hypothetical protein F4805DRAFT_177111 [Annulohypoxylon moriforme]